MTRFAPGDAVFGMPRFPKEAAAYAEYVTAPSRHFARKPSRMTHVEAGGLPLAGLTAWQVLVDTAAVQTKQRVLITAAAGGVGHLAVQIAKARGAHVIGTAQSAKHDFVTSLGADEVIDYTTVDIARAVGDIAIAFDLLGGTSSLQVMPTLKPGGLLVPLTRGRDNEIAEAATQSGIRVARFLVEPDHAGLEALAALASAGQLSVEIDKVFPLEEAAQAHVLGEAGHTRGKIVLTT